VRFGIVKGRVVLSRVNPRLTDARFLIVESVTRENLAAGNGKGGGEEVVVADYLGPKMGSLIAFVEGREGSAPWAPDPAPVDSYLSLIVDGVDYHPEKIKKGG
jgi:microcompartment protein CcmK/EutM